MEPSDLYYQNGESRYYYSSISVITDSRVLINSTWFDCDPSNLVKIQAGKLKFEQLKLIYSPEEIQAMLDKAISSDLESQITARLDQLLTHTQETINDITSRTKLACESATNKIEQAVPVIREAISSSESLQSTISSINRHAKSIKSELPDIDAVKQALESAKTEFDNVTSKLKTLFKD